MKKFTVLTGFFLTSLLMGSLSKASSKASERAYDKYRRDEKAIWAAGRKADEQQRQQIIDDAEERAQGLLIKAGALQDLSGNEKAPDLNPKPAEQQKSEK